jgi:hypothetical protein
MGKRRGVSWEGFVWLFRLEHFRVPSRICSGAVFVVGQVDGDEEAALQHDAFPGNRQQGTAVPVLVEGAVLVAFLDQDGVAVPVGVVRMALPGVVLDKPIDEILDGGKCGMVFGELAEVLGGFERDHMRVTPCGDVMDSKGSPSMPSNEMAKKARFDGKRKPADPGDGSVGIGEVCYLQFKPIHEAFRKI